MKKILVIHDRLEHYRIPLFESLNEEIDLTIAHSSKLVNTDKFNQHKIFVRRIGPFILYKGLPPLNEFDTVVFPFNIRCIQLFKYILFLKRSYKIVVFGIGVSASYSKRYDSDKKFDGLRRLILNKSDAAIFYDIYPLIKYISYGINPQKLSVAYNTVAPNTKFDIKKKEFKSFIFIGSLYKEKKIFDLLIAYESAYTYLNGTLPPLEIIGDGECFHTVQNWIKEKDLEKKIVLCGKLIDDNAVFPVLNRAIACISPGQAGLSVQKCFSYGIPFITSFNAITGGELFSITDGKTGFIYDSSIEGLVSILINYGKGNIDLVEMANNCYFYNKNYRSIELWKIGFLKNLL